MHIGNLPGKHIFGRQTAKVLRSPYAEKFTSTYLGLETRFFFNIWSVLLQNIITELPFYTQKIDLWMISFIVRMS